MKSCSFLLLVFVLVFNSSAASSFSRDGDWLKFDDKQSGYALQTASIRGDYLWMVSDSGFGKLQLSNRNWTFHSFSSIDQDFTAAGGSIGISVVDSSRFAISKANGSILVFDGNNFKKIISPVRPGELLLTKDGRIVNLVKNALYCYKDNQWDTFTINPQNRSVHHLTEIDSGKVIFHGLENVWLFDGDSCTTVFNTFDDIASVLWQPETDYFWIFKETGGVIQFSKNIQRTYRYTSNFYPDAVDKNGFFWNENSVADRYWLSRARMDIEDSIIYLENDSTFEKTFDSENCELIMDENGPLILSPEGVFIFDNSDKMVFISFRELMGNKIGNFGNAGPIVFTKDSSVLIQHHNNFVTKLKNEIGVTFPPITGISSLLERKNGQLLAGSDFGVFSYNDTGWGQVLPLKYVEEIVEDNGGKIWGRTSRCIFRESEHNTWEIIDTSNSSIPDFIRKMVMTKDGVLWITGEEGSCIASSTDGYSWKIYSCEDYLKEGMGFTGLCLGRNNDIIVLASGNKRNELYNVNYKNDNLILNRIAIDSVNYNSTFTHEIFQDSKNNIWVADEGHLHVYGAGTEIVFDSSNSPLGNELSYSFFEDPNGKIWIGSPEGIVIYDPAPIHTIKDKNPAKTNSHFKIITQPHSKSLIAICNSDKPSEISLSLFNLQGKLIYKTSGFYQSGNHRIPLKINFAEGTYLLKYENLKAVEVSKISIK